MIIHQEVAVRSRVKLSHVTFPTCGVIAALVARASFVLIQDKITLPSAAIFVDNTLHNTLKDSPLLLRGLNFFKPISATIVAKESRTVNFAMVQQFS